MTGPVVWMVAACGAAWAIAVLVWPGLRGPELPLGMLGPLAAVTATWVAVVRTFRIDPARVTSVMLKGFAAKMVWFGAYVAAMLTLIDLEPTPFIVSFTVSFIALYGAEAMLFNRLFASGLTGRR